MAKIRGAGIGLRRKKKNEDFWFAVYLDSVPSEKLPKPDDWVQIWLKGTDTVIWEGRIKNLNPQKSKARASVDWVYENDDLDNVDTVDVDVTVDPTRQSVRADAYFQGSATVVSFGLTGDGF